MQILDLYDDPGALVLRQHLGRTAGTLPEKLASFGPAQPEALARVPDRLFALIGICDGQPMRKYAMHDVAHLSTSIVYFLECGAALPDPVRAKVASNLIEACGWYDTAPPLALTKVAFLGAAVNTGLALTAAPATMRAAKQKNQESDAAFRAAQLSGVKQAARAVNTTNGEEAWHTLERFIRGEETPEQQLAAYDDHYPNPFSDPAHLVKEANTAGTEVQSFGGLSQDPRPQTPAKRFATPLKTSGWNDVGAFSLREPASAATEVTHYALPHQGLYPIDTPEEVKRASVYFDEYASAFELADRRVFAQSVATRGEELGVKVGGLIAKVAGNEYGPHILTELHGRIRALEGTGKEAAYEVLLEHLDETPPIVMVDMLKRADEDARMDTGYGRPVTGFRDPLSAVFGAPERPIYSWDDCGHYVTEEILRSYAKLVPDLDKLIEEGFSTKFVNDPVKAFDKLPTAKKIVISRLANGEAFRYM